jgi:SAM-dependent methyltransferase
MDVNRLIKRPTRWAADWVDLQWSFIEADLRDAAKVSHGCLLDVGCGDKPYQMLFRPYVTNYVGVEHSATFTQTNASKEGRPDLLYDGLAMPFSDCQFDTVLNVQVLEHTPEPQMLVDEMARLLRPGGTLILIAPFSFRLHEEPFDYFRYSPHGLRAMLKKSGIEVIEVRAQGGLFSVLSHKINTFLAFRVGRLGSLVQVMGKLAYERPAAEHPRYWVLPAILPAILALSFSARLLDRAFPEPTEALSFLVIARKERADLWTATLCPS